MSPLDEQEIARLKKKGVDHPYGVCLTVAYDGSRFHGWQFQDGLRTVQGTVEDAIDASGFGRSRLRGASRTDAGVHALGQVAAFGTDKEIPPRGWMHMLNGALPEDVSIQRAEPCWRRYNPRFDAKRKLYRYLVYYAEPRDPLRRSRYWHLRPDWGRRDHQGPRETIHHYLNVDAMHEAAAHMVGEHDFHAFRSSADDRKVTRRTMHDVRILPGYHGQEDAIAIEVEGSAFMKNMVRIMAGTLVDVGRGRFQSRQVLDFLSPEAKRADLGVTAPAEGLTLVHLEIGRQEGYFDPQPPR